MKSHNFILQQKYYSINKLYESGEPFNLNVLMKHEMTNLNQ